MKFVDFFCLYTVLFLLFQQIQLLESISCFQCSLLGTKDSIECPSRNEDISKWINLKDKYVLKSNSKSFSCLVGVDKTLKVYYQVNKIFLSVHFVYANPHSADMYVAYKEMHTYFRLVKNLTRIIIFVTIISWQFFKYERYFWGMQYAGHSFVKVICLLSYETWVSMYIV